MINNKVIVHAKPKFNYFKDFAITITLKPIYTSMLTHQEQYELFVPRLIDILGDDYFPFICIVSTELTIQNNLHFHLLASSFQEITRKDVYESFRIRLQDTEFGFFYVKPIECRKKYLGWLNYMNKDQYFYEKYSYAF